MSHNKPYSNSRISQIISLIDLTNLNDNCDKAAIETLCDQATTIAGPVAAVCVWPQYVKTARVCIGENSPIKIATVANFPSGDEPLATTAELISKAIDEGANEIDYVLPYADLVNGKQQRVASAMRDVRSLVPNSVALKVILETGELATSELIRSASTIAIEHGADFLKTSTGKVPVNATPEAAATMLDTIAASGKNIGFKAAGGIKTIDDANTYLELAEDRLGKDWATPAHLRLGASSLLENALSNLQRDG